MSLALSGCPCSSLAHASAFHGVHINFGSPLHPCAATLPAMGVLRCRAARILSALQEAKSPVSLCLVSSCRACQCTSRVAPFPAPSGSSRKSSSAGRPASSLSRLRQSVEPQVALHAQPSGAPGDAALSFPQPCIHFVASPSVRLRGSLRFLAPPAVPLIRSAGYPASRIFRVAVRTFAGCPASCVNSGR